MLENRKDVKLYFLQTVFKTQGFYLRKIDSVVVIRNEIIFKNIYPRILSFRRNRGSDNLDSTLHCVPL